MTAVDKVIRELARLPEPLVNEVLDFIAYLEIKHGLKDIGAEQLSAAQLPAMKQLWDNPEDDAWNDA
jgi:hypothetical protein